LELFENETFSKNPKIDLFLIKGITLAPQQEKLFSNVFVQHHC